MTQVGRITSSGGSQQLGSRRMNKIACVEYIFFLYILPAAQFQETENFPCRVFLFDLESSYLTLLCIPVLSSRILV